MANTNGTAVVTGASSGIGAIYADRLAKRGYDLVLVARDQARMDALAAHLRGENGVTIETLAADLTADADVAKVEHRLSAGDVRLLINNAGMSLNGGILDNDAVQLTRIITLNVTAPTRLASAAGKAFVKRGGGAIVNIGSVVALAPERFEGVYSGTKAFLLNLSLSMSASLKDKAVYVQAVLPGATRTEIWERSGKDVNSFPAEMVMEAGNLVDAALVGFDRRETVTMPSLSDETQWTTLQEARLAIAPNLSRRDVAARYLTRNKS
jgi:short-subunit dehydrogenase